MGVGVTAIEAAVPCGVSGVPGCWTSILGLAICEAARAREWLLSRRLLGASLILGWVWH